MDKNEIITILQDWNFWQKEIDIGLLRNAYLDKLKNLMQSRQIVVITGARRSGKSFIMRQLAKELIEQGVKRENILIINLEDPRFIDLNVELLEKIYQTYLEFLKPQGKHYLFLDEIQEVEKWEKWVSMIQELRKAQVVLSGSNAKLLSRELATLLTGRHLDIEVLPLSFKEFSRFYKIANGRTSDQAMEIRGLLRSYLEEGAFPEVVLNKQKKEILLSYFDDILAKDLIKRYKVRKKENLKELLKFYFSNLASLTTFRSLAKTLQISPETVENFSSYFETNYLIFFLKRFSFKVKEQEKSPRKVYAVDTGLANAVGFRFSENIGRLAENAVFLQILRKSFDNPYLEAYYWKDERHKEVDFLLKEKNDLKQLVQVCWDISDLKTKEREIDNLIKASDQLCCDDLLIITGDKEDEEEIKGRVIKFVPLWKWLGQE